MLVNGLQSLQNALSSYRATPNAEKNQYLYKALATLHDPIAAGKNPTQFLPAIAQNPYLSATNYHLMTPTVQCPTPTSLWCENAFIRIGSGNLTLVVKEDNEAIGNPVVEIHRSDAEKMGAYIFAAKDQDGKTITVAVAPVCNPGTFWPMNNQGAIYFNNGYFGITVHGSNGGFYTPLSKNEQGLYTFPQVNESYNSAICAGGIGGFQLWSADESYQFAKISDFSDFGVAIAYTANRGGTMTAYPLQGSPYMSLEYEGSAIQPTFNNEIAIIQISSNTGGAIANPKYGDTVTGTAFVVQYQDKSTYKIYASESVTFTLDYADLIVTPVAQGTIQQGDPHYLAGGPPPLYIPFAQPQNGQNNTPLAIGKLTLQNPINGKIRFRIASLPIDSNNQVIAAAEALLDAHKDVIPIQGTANAIAANQWAYAYQSIDFATGQPTANPPLITLTYPDAQSQPQDANGQNPIQSEVTLPSIRGSLAPAVGSYLTFTSATAIPSQWYDDRVNIWQNLGSAARKTLLEQFTADADFYPNEGLQTMFPTGWTTSWTTGKLGDAYSAGKRLQAAAQVPLFLDKLSRDAQTVEDGASAQAFATARDSAIASVKFWVGICLAQGFVYDSQLGMVIEAVSVSDPVGSNYQNAAGQDHIFHYGYFVQAAAIAASFDPQWANTPFQGNGIAGTYGDVVNALIRDVCNPALENGDRYFPAWRQTNWLEGHASANALAGPAGSGRNEESFAEEINFWHGMQMWGKVTGNNSVEAIGSVMRSRANAACQTWVQLGTAASQTVYQPFWNNITQDKPYCFCNIWSNSSQAQTWFGDGTKSLLANLPYNVGIEVISTVPQLLTDLVNPDWLEAIGSYFEQNLWTAYQEFGAGYNFLAILLPMLSQYSGDFAVQVMDNPLFDLDNGTTSANLMFNIAYRHPAIATLPKFQTPTPARGGWVAFGGMISRSQIESTLALILGAVPFLQSQTYNQAQAGLSLITQVLVPQLQVWQNQSPSVSDALSWMMAVENNNSGNCSQYQPFTDYQLTGSAILQAWNVVKGWLLSPPSGTTQVLPNQIAAWLPLFGDPNTVAYLPTLQLRGDILGVEILTALQTYLEQTMLQSLLTGKQPIGQQDCCQSITAIKAQYDPSKVSSDTKSFWNGAVTQLVQPSMAGCQNVLF